MTPPTLAQTIQQFREFAGFTQSELADEIPVTLRTLQRWESRNGTKPVPIAHKRLNEIMDKSGFLRTG
jgi:DNA-binding transcriptional regulator YiaG|tara:strand:+ start:160 stop:363 length:204 start_codon:yes stop_codon:yes gene_type:complete